MSSRRDPPALATPGPADGLLQDGSGWRSPGHVWYLHDHCGECRCSLRESDPAFRRSMGDSRPRHPGRRQHDGDGALTSYADERVTDAELVAGFRRDPELFTAVYDRYFRDIYLYVAGRLDVQVADDIAAEAFLVAFGQRARFDRDRGSLRPWLFGIATNLVARHRRKEARYYRALARMRSEPPADSHEGRVLAAAVAERLRARLAMALTTLSPGERDVVLLVAISELSHLEVAEALGISCGTVGSRLSRARKKLHDAIGPEAVDG
jgi:RNA polymerase sigma factor (sigma-70 family)